jgi:NTE family protein
MMLPLLLSNALMALSARGRRIRRLRQRRRLRPPGPGPGTKRINLALQGGGAHGAFTWGVLDALLSDGRLVIDGISGASAGAVNAVVLADGLERGGPEVAKTRLEEFWRAASFDGSLPPLQRNVVERLFAFVPRPGSPWLGALSQMWSPYDLNPLNINPLKDLIERFVDFDLIRHGEHELFIAATAVRTGKLRVFTRNTVTAAAVTASACLPLLFRAVEIGGEPYWDGGYSGNPPLTPFLRATATEDVLIVQINPIEQRKALVSAPDIRNRLHEINFNASLLGELRALELAGRLIEEGGLPRGTGAGQYRRLRLHRIALEEPEASFDAGSKLNTNFDYLERLRALGERAGRRFLDDHFDDLGQAGTIDARVAAQAELV